MKNLFLLMIAGLLWVVPAAAEDESDNADGEHQLTTPAERAAESDYVVLAQLDAYKYEEKRKFPVSGDTWFDVLLTYKAPRKIHRLTIFEEGLGDDKCYFDHVELFGEMPRFLLFLNDDPDSESGKLRGHPDGCAVAVVATTSNEYVVRWPLDSMRFEDPEAVEALTKEYDFHGPGAFVNLGELVGYRIEEEAARQHLEKVEDRRGRHAVYRYTRGIPLNVFRTELIGAENLKPESKEEVDSSS